MKKKLLRHPLVVAIVVALFGAIGFLLRYYFFNSDRESTLVLSAEESAGSINTIGQIGDNTLVNNLDIPEPNISLKKVSFLPVEEGYKHEFSLNIEAKVSLKQLNIKALAPGIIKMEIKAQRSGTVFSGASGVRDGFAFDTLQDAYGEYEISIVTKSSQEIKFEYDYI